MQIELMLSSLIINHGSSLMWITKQWISLYSYKHLQFTTGIVKSTLIDLTVPGNFCSKFKILVIKRRKEKYSEIFQTSYMILLKIFKIILTSLEGISHRTTANQPPYDGAPHHPESFSQLLANGKIQKKKRKMNKFIKLQ